MQLTTEHVNSAICAVSVTCFLLSCNLTGADNRNPELTTVFDVSNCTKEDFNNRGFCQLDCLSATENLYEWHWIYYIDTPSENATLYEDVHISDVTLNAVNYTQISLNLTNYSAGYYRCWYHYVVLNATGYFSYADTKDFKIDPEERGVSLSCNTSDQCLTLDASCVNATCQCQYPFAYPLLNPDSETAVACLRGVGPFRPCNNDQQCFEAGDNYQCSNDICNCSPNATYMYAGEANEYLCLLPATIGQWCEYSEECMLTHFNSWCYEGVCGCKDNYVYNDTLGYCLNSTSYTPDDYPDDNVNDITFGEIVGIVLGTATVIAISIGIVIFCITRR